MHMTSTNTETEKLIPQSEEWDVETWQFRSVIKISIMSCAAFIPIRAIQPLFALVAQQQLGANMEQIGILIASFLVAPMLGGFLWSSIGDTLGHNRVAVIFVLIQSIGLCVMIVWENFWLWLVGEFMFGVCLVQAMIASAYIASISSEMSIIQNTVISQFANGFSFILGPLLGAVLFSHSSSFLLMLTCIGFLVIAQVTGIFLWNDYAIFLAHETERPQLQLEREDDADSDQQTKTCRAVIQLTFLFACSFCLDAAFCMFDAWFIFTMSIEFGVAVMTSGSQIALSATVMIGLVGFLSTQNHSVNAFALFVTAVMCKVLVSMLCSYLFVSNRVELYWLAIPLFGACDGCVVVAQAIVTGIVCPPTWIEQVTGVAHACSVLGSATGVLVYSWLYAAGGLNLFEFMSGGFVLALICALVLAALRRLCG